MAVGNSISGATGISGAVASANVGFNVTATFTTATGYSVSVPSGQTRVLRADELFSVKKFDWTTKQSCNTTGLRTASGARLSLPATAVILAITAGLLLSGCTPNGSDAAFSRDPAVDTLPTVGISDGLLTKLPRDLQSHVVASAVGDAAEFAVALHAGECAIAASSNGEAAAAKTSAPSAAGDPVSSPPWAGARNTLGPTSSVDAVVGDTTFTLFCGPKGAGVRIQPGAITSRTGAISTAPESTDGHQNFVVGPSADGS
ncbi:hypothetical protein [Leifsonia williamsii]|uniref:hypothetical protein n=1 Tax=Leifsonia williamsii TaxID=3035919 RepID=UPI00263A80C0|nr:hypothetical protein [Leifsonia williamsii]